MKKLALVFGMILYASTASAVSEYRIGTEVSHITYKEPGYMKESGMMYGVVGSYTYQNKLFLRGEGKYAWGQVDYSSPISGTMDGIDDTMIEGRGLVGYEIKNWNVIPYSGVGYRYLKDDMAGMETSVGHMGYKRESNYVYIPLGVEIKRPMKSWTVTLQGELDALVYGKQSSHLGSIVGYNDIENKQDCGFGQRVSLNLSKGNFVAGVYVRHWDVRMSNEQEGLPGVMFVEPRNQSMEIGLEAKVRF